jgi:CIC family chloride channel protein
MTPKPTVITDLSSAAIQEAAKAHPYDRFPVVRDGALAGILTRREALAAVAANRPPTLEVAKTCRPDQTILELQNLLIESTTQFVVVKDRDGEVKGVITLHDLLRAQVQKAGG